MKKILKISGKSKVRRANREEVKDLEGYWAMGIEGRLALIQELMPLGVMHIKEELQAEVRRLAGDRYKRNGMSGYCRWTRQKGSVYIKDQKVPIMYQRVRAEIKLINESAVASLDEGFDETLTVHRLGMHGELKRSFRTTNIIESVMALIGQKTDKVDYWRNSSQKQRWVAASLLHIEQRLNKVNGYRHLSKLRSALQRGIDLSIEIKKAVAT